MQSVWVLLEVEWFGDTKVRAVFTSYEAAEKYISQQPLDYDMYFSVVEKEVW